MAAKLAIGAMARTQSGPLSIEAALSEALGI
jgi:hypothetical protein